MTLNAKHSTRHLLWLALLAVIGLVGLFLTTGNNAKAVFFLVTCWPLLIGIGAYLRHRRSVN